MYCTNCNQLLPDNAKFCSNCGSSIVPEEPIEEQPSQLQANKEGNTQKTEIMPLPESKILNPKIFIIPSAFLILLLILSANFFPVIV